MTAKRSLLAAARLAALAGIGLGGCVPETEAPVIPSADGTYAVSSAAQLRVALEAAAHDRRDSRVALAAGRYATGGVPFEYLPDADEGFALAIVGTDRETTVLDGEGQSAVLAIDLVSALADDADAAILVRDLTIEDGHAVDRVGAGLYVAASSAPVSIERCSFLGNETESPADDALGGGAYVVAARGNVVVRDALFEGNRVAAPAGQANGAGLALLVSGGGAEVAGSRFHANAGRGYFAARGAGAFLLSEGAGTLDVHDNTVTDNMNDASSGLAVAAGLEARSLNAGAISLARNHIESNASTGLVAANGAGVAAIVAAGRLSFSRNDLRGNTGISEAGSAFGGGAYLLSTTAGPIVADGNRFEGNEVRGDDALGVRGGAASIESEQQGKLVLTNNVVSKNAARSEHGFATAGGVFAGAFFEADLDVTHNTFFANQTTGSGGGLVVTGLSVLNVFGNLLVENVAANEAPDLLALDARSGALGAVVRLVRNGFASALSACEATVGCTPRVVREETLASDPRFVDAPAGDFRLSSGSPAIDAGTAGAPSLPDTDGAGHARVIGAAPDLGAVEAGCGDDVSARVAVHAGGFRLNHETRRFVQVLTLTNSGPAPLPAPLAVVVSDVSRTVALANPTGASTCAAPIGHDVVSMDLGAAQSLAPGKSAAVVLEFTNPNALAIGYQAHVISGAF